MQIFQTSLETNKLMIAEEISKGCWIHLTNPSDSEVDFVSKKTGISEDMLKTALDEEEKAHVDKEDLNKMVVIDVPMIADDEQDWLIYTTIPLAIIYNEDYFVTVCLKECGVINDFFSGRIKQFSTRKRFNLLLQVLYCNALKFLYHLRQIEKTNHRTQAELHKSMKNKELLQLLDLEKSLVYFSTALKSNESVLYRVQKFEDVKKYEEDLDLLDDVLIENKQAAEMCTIYRDILSGTMDAFASIISNNLNIVMKILTMITIIISIPTLVASFWGMNVPVPFAGSWWGFLIVVAISLVLTIFVSVILMKSTNKMGKRRK